MYIKSANLLSLLLIIIYSYWKTRDKSSLFMLCCFASLWGGATIFRRLFPDIPFRSPTIEYMVFLVIVGVVSLVFLMLSVAEVEKRRTNKTEERDIGFRSLLTLSRENIIFWTIIVLINLIAFLLE